MAKQTIEAYGVSVDLTPKSELIEIMDGMLEDGAAKMHRAKTNKSKRVEKSSIAFFGSIRHYLRGGEKDEN